MKNLKLLIAAISCFSLLLTGCNSSGAFVPQEINQLPSFVQFEYTQLSLYENETFELKLIAPSYDDFDFSVTYYSSNSNIATVSDGLVTALKKGEVKITAALDNGLTTTCNLTVYDPMTNVDYGYLVKDQVVQIKPFGQSDSLDGITLVSEDSNIVEINNDGTSFLCKQGGITHIFFVNNKTNSRCGSSLEVNIIEVAVFASVYSLFGESLRTESNNTTDLGRFYYRRRFDNVSGSFTNNTSIDGAIGAINISFRCMVQTKGSNEGWEYVYHNIYLSVVKGDASKMTLLELDSQLSTSPKGCVMSSYSEKSTFGVTYSFNIAVSSVSFPSGGIYSVIVHAD